MGQAVADSHIVERGAVEEKVVAVAEVASFQANRCPVVPRQEYYLFTTITTAAIVETSYKCPYFFVTAICYYNDKLYKIRYILNKTY